MGRDYYRVSLEHDVEGVAGLAGHAEHHRAGEGLLAQSKPGAGTAALAGKAERNSVSVEAKEVKRESGGHSYECCVIVSPKRWRT